ncbi:helix-turn-helix domain-containing protein [Candidatus Chlorohelix sp.]|uniref:helix-turn-helix domain-containing protein n=1 Tax=Candidatus Chlorohelix sp. TaxID=3139201 RepID=UPI00304E2FB5
MITFAELYQKVLPPQAVLLTENEDLGREVSWVVVSRSRTPLFDDLKGGELVLISMRSLRLIDEEIDIDRLFGYLAERGVSGVAIMGQINDSAISTAKEFALPLLSLPEGTSLSELERSLTKYIVEHRQILQQWTQDVIRQFTELVIEGKGLAAIAERLCQLTESAVIIEDSSFRLRARSLPDLSQPIAANNSRPKSGYTSGNSQLIFPENYVSGLREHAQSVREWLASKDLRAADPPLHTFENGAGLLQLTAPIIVQATISGYVSILGKDFTNIHRVAVIRAASACAIERSREIAVSAVEDRFQANVLDEIIDGTFTNADAVVERGKRLSYNLNLPYCVITFAFRNSEAKNRKKPLTIVLDGQELELDLPISENMARELQRLVEQEATRRQLSIISRVRDDRFVLFFGSGKDKANHIELKKNAKIFHDRVQSHFTEMSVSAGLGRFYEGIEGISRSAQESEKSVTMGLKLFGAGNLTYFGDLGVYRLLLTISNQKELREFYQEVLGKLLEHDSRNGGELMQTLESYFKYHGSPSKMAEGMSLHRNTLLYRLRRIQEILGVEFEEDAEARLGLHLALRIGEVLGERR